MKVGTKPARLDGKLPEIPKGAVAIGMVKKGSVIYELPPFSRYLVFHESEIPKIITYDGQMVNLDVDNPASVAK